MTSIKKKLSGDPFFKLFEAKISELTKGEYVIAYQGSAGYFGTSTEISDLEFGVLAPQDIYDKYIFEKALFYLGTYLIRMIPFLLLKSEKHAFFGLLLSTFYINTSINHIL